MINPVPPVFIYFIGAAFLPLAGTRRLQQIVALAVPVLAFFDLILMDSPGVYWTFAFLQYKIVLGSVDKLSMVFAYVFVIISFIGMVYAIHIKESGQHVAALFYAGSSLGVVFSGDLFSLLAFWELMAVSSVFLIWYQKNQAALDAGFRYLLVHIAGGAILMAGIMIHVAQTGSIAFGLFNFHTLAARLIFIGFIINAAVPPLHAWLPDAYPEGTITGSVFLTAFTTKSAVYVLARSFPGLEMLVWLGAVMALYGVVYAVMEKGLRRLLAYHIVSQVGYMVCGVGLGSRMAINGAVAHAFSHIIYKALLFMGAGAVIHVTGCRKMTALQGRRLYRKMPMTLTLYMIGAFSISGVPLFNGFISKSMVVDAAGALHRPIIELMLHLASVGTWLSVGLKLPWGTWFGLPRQDGQDIAEAKEPSGNMLAGMTMAAFLCILTGIFPSLLYRLLPYPVDYVPYTGSHVVSTLQTLLLTVAGFWLCLNTLMSGKPKLILDTDWFYRMFGRALMRFCNVYLNRISAGLKEIADRQWAAAGRFSRNPYVLVDMIRRGMKGSRTLRDQGSRSEAHPLPFRFPIGVGIFASLAFLFLFGLAYLVLPLIGGG